MPTYVYRCSECDDEFEAHQRIVEPPLTVCPEGHAGTVKRVIQPVGIAFKGSGFYVNDSAGSSAPKAKSEPKPEGTTTETPSEGSSPDTGAGETKSEPKVAENKPSESKPAPTKPEASTPAQT